MSKKIKAKEITVDAFKKMYLETTVRSMARFFDVTPGAIYYHARKMGILHIKTPGRFKRVHIIKGGK